MSSFRTNIKCGGCVQKVKPFLDKVKGIDKWQVDLESADRILSIEGDAAPELIVKAIAAAGYKADLIF